MDYMRSGTRISGTRITRPSRLDASFIDDLVFFAQDDDARLPGLGECFFDRGIAHDGEAVAGFAEVGGGAIENDGARAAVTRDQVSLEALAVGEVAAEDFLVGVKAD